MTAASKDYLAVAMFNGALVDPDALVISPLGSGFMFGEGLFETIRIREFIPLRFGAHYARLTDSARPLGALVGSSRDRLHDRCLQVIAANSVADGSLKIIFFREPTGWAEMILARSRTYSAVQYENGFRLKTMAGALRSPPLSAMKSLNYLPNLLAQRLARSAGFDEALWVGPHTKVLEGATSNVFVVKAGAVSTPPLSGGILPGVMRAEILRMSGTTPVSEREVSLEEILHADEVFVTNALLGIMPVAAVDETAFDLGANPVTRRLMAELNLV